MATAERCQKCGHDMPCPLHENDPAVAWWDSLTDDERDATLAAATTGSWSDYSYLDGEDD